MPSEILALRWQDVDFENGRLVVHASKTAHHDDGGVRVVPIFPEIAEHLQRVFDEADDGTTHVISRYGDSSTNLRTQFQRYIKRAGVKPWPKLWQNLRASRATELADEFPSHVCAAWLGHTERVADAHYRTVTDDHFKRAISAAQNPAQQVHVDSSKGKKDDSAGRSEVNCMQPLADGCDSMQEVKVGDTGLEQQTSLPEKTGDSEESGAECGAPSPLSITDPNLARIMTAWNGLPEPLRRGIVAMVEAAKRGM